MWKFVNIYPNEVQTEPHSLENATWKLLRTLDKYCRTFFYNFAYLATLALTEFEDLLTSMQILQNCNYPGEISLFVKVYGTHV